MDIKDNLQKAVRDVLGTAVLSGNLSKQQADEIQKRFDVALLKQLNVSKQNETATTNNQCRDVLNGCEKFTKAGVCPFVTVYMKGLCEKTCGRCAGMRKYYYFLQA